MAHSEPHRSHRIGWLRAGVLGANDGIVSTASLIIGVAAANTSTDEILIAGTAALVAGAMSMAAGEYVSVSSQADTEKADLAMEAASIASDREAETQELTAIYQARGLDHTLAQQVAVQLMKHDALAAHARDDIGIALNNTTDPLQAAWSSAFTFILGAVLPLITAWLSPAHYLIYTVAFASLFSLAILGAVSAKIGGAKILTSVIRVMFWGALAMLFTAMIGQLFG